MPRVLSKGVPIGKSPQDCLALPTSFFQVELGPGKKAFYSGTLSGDIGTLRPGLVPHYIWSQNDSKKTQRLVAKGNEQEKRVGDRGREPGKAWEGRWGERRRGGYLGEVRVGVEPTLVADLVVTLGAGVEVWLAGGRREVRGLTYGTQHAAGKRGDLGDGVG